MLNLDRVLQKWAMQDIALEPPLSRDLVVSALSKTGRVYSNDVVEVYSQTGGMKDWGMDNHCWSFWTLDMLQKENAAYTSPFLIFGDFLINSHQYCYRYESEEHSSVCIDYRDGDEPEVISRSVVEFFDRYLVDPGSLGMWG